MNAILEPEVQRKLALQSFFEGEGYKAFREQLDMLLLGAKDHIESMCKSGYVDEKKLAELNFKLGRKDAFEKVGFVLDDMKDELQERTSPSPALKGKK